MFLTLPLPHIQTSVTRRREYKANTMNQLNYEIVLPHERQELLKKVKRGDYSRAAEIYLSKYSIGGEAPKRNTLQTFLTSQATGKSKYPQKAMYRSLVDAIQEREKAAAATTNEMSNYRLSALSSQ